MADRTLDLLHARLGPRILLLVPVWAGIVAAAVCALMCLGGTLYFDVPLPTMLVSCLAWIAVYVVLALPFLGRARRDLAPVFGWASSRPTPEGAAAACRALVGVTPRARRFGRLLLALTPLNAISFALILDQPWWFAFPAFVLAVTTMGGVTTALTAMSDVLQLPLRRELFAHLPAAFEVPEHRPSLAVQPVALTPIPMLTAALFVGALGGVTDDGAERFALAAAVGIALVASVSVVVALRARAWVAPVDELIAAASRVEAGDLDASIPVVGSDESGTLAQHFNAMLAGLRERETLRTDLIAREAELRASRDRIIKAGDTERRRVERNLHDGAQQRLVALQLDLRLLEDAATSSGQPELAELSANAQRGLRCALDELRDLARGLHPLVLDSDGLAPAIRQLADRSPVPVTVAVDVERLPAGVESALYFVASEALANVAKHAGASEAAVTVVRRGDAVTLEIQDDGVGGARPSTGSGISGLADRIDAAGGTLRILSPPGAGTTIGATVPVPEDAR